MKRRQRTIIGLHSDAVRVLTLRSGRVVSEARVRIKGVRSEDAWNDGLRVYDDALARALAEAGVATPVNATAVYDAPTAAVTATVARAAGRAGAASALLELETRGGVDLSAQAHASWVVATTCAGHALTVAVTDSPRALDTLATCFARAGVTLTGAVPTEAVGLAAALRVHDGASEQGPRIAAYLGEWCSGVVVSSGDEVRFVRSSPLTVDALVRALCPNENAALEPALAHRLLTTAGLPDADPDRPASPEFAHVNMHDARAAIQPLLQRTAVDLRQSLRFGLGKEDMDRASMTTAGDATRIRGLVPLVSELLGVQRTGAAAFDDTAHLVESIDRLRLVDDDRLETTHAGALRKALWVGAAAAIGVSVAQWMIASDEHAKAQNALSTLRAGAQGIESINARTRGVEQQEQLVARIERAANDAAGFTPRWPGWFVDVAQRRPERIVLLGMSATRDQNDRAAVAINGAVLPQDTPERADDGSAGPATAKNPSQHDLLRSFIDALAESPLVEGVELGATRRGAALGVNATSFQLTITLRAAPAHLESTDVAEATP